MEKSENIFDRERRGSQRTDREPAEEGAEQRKMIFIGLDISSPNISFYFYRNLIIN